MPVLATTTATAVSAPTYSTLAKLDRHHCRDCTHHVMEARVRSVNVIRCTETTERVTGFQRACEMFDPSPALVRRLTHQADRSAQHAIAVRQKPPAPAVKLKAGDKCPRCGSRLLNDWGDLVCLLCGTQHYAQPWAPSPSGGVWPQQGVVDPFGY